MRFRFLVIFLFFLISCENQPVSWEHASQETTAVEIPQVEFRMNEVFFNRKNSLWQLRSDSTTVSGYIIERFANDQIARHLGVFEGKREGVLTAYYPSGRVRFIENYKNNKLDGAVKRWSKEAGYQLLAELSYEARKLHGVQKMWFPTGELHKLMHMKRGKEDGLQQAFRKNGALYANYEARNGRIFGLKRSNLCYELDNQQVVYKD
ncbi:hypothetical protein [Reichenbachiella sp.]|uniref:toxin-antitoxin system YwqK family antitoxin n=1 Tax=Reichenbachiella sp. TaxID=2184521 RepID=UPI003299515D